MLNQQSGMRGNKLNILIQLRTREKQTNVFVQNERVCEILKLHTSSFSASETQYPKPRGFVSGHSYSDWIELT